MAVILAIGLMTKGCAVFVVGAAAGAGAAGVAYVKGDMRACVKADPRAVEKASVKAFEVLDIHKVSSGSSALDAEVVGRTAAEMKVTIKAKIEATGESSVTIRVGTFGDEPLSRRIYDEVNTHLPDAIRELEKELKSK
ncbi:MAG: DUF3568 family protein [Candidatus Kuenenia sp.]|nr:DUF3568 family protein [Candidatus Kuenenia hertensis]